jgi:hypothetical protein
MIHVHAVVWATAKYGSLNSATDWLVIRYYLNLNGYKFMNYNNWIKSRELPHYDWLCYIAWNHQSSKSKELISFPYTSVIRCILQRLASKSWSFSCVMADHSGRVSIFPPFSEANTVKRVPLLPWGPTTTAPLSLSSWHKRRVE